jgi:hypothetical protein
MFKGFFDLAMVWLVPADHAAILAVDVTIPFRNSSDLTDIIFFDIP